MRTETRTVRIGEPCGPIDWSHPTAKDMPEIWRDAEKSPDDFLLNDDFVRREICYICMYDGWPYWKPTPAMLVSGTLGPEWKFFNSYGVRPSSIVRKASAGRNPEGEDREDGLRAEHEHAVGATSAETPNPDLSPQGSKL